MVESMKKVSIFTECPDSAYYSSLYHLQEGGFFKVEMYDSRLSYLIAKFIGFGKSKKQVKYKQQYPSHYNK